MRINIYSQELTKEVEIVETTADTGITYYGLRWYLASPDILHHTVDDDDRSAITIWIPNAKSYSQQDLVNVLLEMARQVANLPEVPSN